VGGGGGGGSRYVEGEVGQEQADHGVERVGQRALGQHLADEQDRGRRHRVLEICRVGEQSRIVSQQLLIIIINYY